jgi:hypothetical protein
MRSPRLALLAAVLAIFAVPSVASAEYLIPPGNSAVNQYTESVPTSGGPRDINRGPKGGDRSPAEVLGKDKAQRLESQGPDGRSAAQVVAATAPVSGGFEPAGGGGTQTSGSAPGSGGAAKGGTAAAPGGGGAAVQLEGQDGSSGLGEVLGQATGSSSGQMGLLLPLVLLATAAWALAFFWRQRDRRAP